MEQPKYRYEDLRFAGDRSYTDINEVIVGFLIDKGLVIDCDNKEKLTEIVNNMLAERYEKTRQVLYPSDFEISMSVEMDTHSSSIGSASACGMKNTGSISTPSPLTGKVRITTRCCGSFAMMRASCWRR